MELTTTQKRQRLLTMIFGAIAIFFTELSSRMVDLSAIRDGTGLAGARQQRLCVFTWH